MSGQTTTEAVVSLPSPSVVSQQAEQAEERRFDSTTLFYTNNITEVCHRLRVTSLATSIALNYFHRVRKSPAYNTLDSSLLGAACVFLACKVADCPVHLRDVVNVSFKFYHNVDLQLGETYSNIRESIINCELLVVRALGFSTEVQTPHKLLLHFISGLMRSRPTPEHVDWHALSQVAWMVMCDSFRIPDSIGWTAPYTATASIYFGVTALGISERLPTDWWSPLSPHPESDLLKYCHTMHAFYQFEGDWNQTLLKKQEASKPTTVAPQTSESAQSGNLSTDKTE